jgi:hypothetical protein
MAASSNWAQITASSLATYLGNIRSTYLSLFRGVSELSYLSSFWSPLYIAAFSESEREVLSSFHTTFELAADAIGQPPARMSDLHALDTWKQVIAAAQAALSAMHPIDG